MFRQKDKKSAQLLYECAGYEFDSYDDFKATLDKQLVDKTFLIVDKEDENSANMYKYMRAPASIPRYSLNY